MSKFTKKDIGRRVHLPENKEEGTPEEYGQIFAVPSDGGDGIIVEVDEEYLHSSLDDGLREVHEDDVELDT